MAPGIAKDTKIPEGMCAFETLHRDETGGNRDLSVNADLIFQAVGN